MNNFGTMYVFELKKIFKRKIVWITLAVMVLISIFMGVAETLSINTYVTEGDETEISGYEAIKREKENDLTIIGKKIDDALLSEVKDAYKGIYYTTYSEERVAVTGNISSEESVEDAKKRVKEQERLRKIYLYVRRITGDDNAIHVIDEDGLYEERMKNIQEEMTAQELTEGERAYWQEREEAITKPFTYGYAAGWELVLGELYSLNSMQLLVIAICLSTLFSEEHVRKTDQLILCSRYGKQKLYFAKLLAGITFALCSAFVLFLCSLVPTLLTYGTDGFDVALQIYAPMACWDITMGQAVLLMLLVYLAAAVLNSVISMFLSEALRNSVAVMGLMTGGMFLTLVIMIPTKYRVISQIYELLPTTIMGLWKFSDYRLINIFGGYFTNLQFAPILYVICSMVLIFVGTKLYRNYQVSGR